MVMATVALLAKDPDPDDATIRRSLAGNLCRCGGYPRILRAVRAAAQSPSAQTDDSTVRAEQIEPAASSTWTVVLPPLGRDGRSGWGWSTPGGARLTLDSSGLVRAYTGKVDGGQGNRVSLTRMVAAELSVPTSMIRIEMGDTEVAPFDLGTFGSRSTPDVGHALRLLAVATRRALLTEAAQHWEVSPHGLVTADGAVRDPATGREVAFGTLVADGPRTMAVDPDELLDTALPGLDGVDPAQLRQGLVRAVTGAKQFPSDVRLPGMLHGAVLRPPAYGARLRRVDTTTAQRLPGVTVVDDDGFVGAVAPSPAAARAAVRAVSAEWEPVDGPGDVGLGAYLRDHPVDSPDWGGSVRREVGDVDAALAASDVQLEATYTTPYIAHVPMEPRVAVAHVEGDRVDGLGGQPAPVRRPRRGGRRSRTARGPGPGRGPGLRRRLRRQALGGRRRRGGPPVPGGGRTGAGRVDPRGGVPLGLPPPGRGHRRPLGREQRRHPDRLVVHQHQLGCGRAVHALRRPEPARGVPAGRLAAAPGLLPGTGRHRQQLRP